MTPSTRLLQLTTHIYPRPFSTTTQQLKMSTTHQSDASLASRAKHAPGNKPVEKSHRSSATDCTQHWEDEEHLEQNKKHFAEFRAQAKNTSSSSAESSGDSGSNGGSDSASGGDDGDHGAVPGGMKRGRGANQAASPSKKPKNEEQRDPASLPRGDKTRVPAVGQRVHWKAGKGYAKGEVVEVLYEDKEVEGKKAEASKEDPRLVLKTESSGRLAVHKPEDVHFD